MTEHFNYNAEIAKEIKQLKETIKTQQEAVNAAAHIIDELRKENKQLKNGLYLRDITNELNGYKQKLSKTYENYITLNERYNKLMNEYIKL